MNLKLVNKLSYKRIYYIFILGLLFSCSSSDITTVKISDYTTLYNPLRTKIHPAISIYHDDEQTSTVFIKLYPKDLLYSRANVEGKNLAKVKIQFELFDISDTETTLLADSGVFIKTYDKDSINIRDIITFPVNAIKERNYYIKILTIDLNRKDENLKFLYIDKKSDFGTQTFLVKDEKTSLPYFAPFIVGNRPFKFNNPNIYNFDSLFIYYYGNDFPLPKPTYAESDEVSVFSHPDSIWQIPFNKITSYVLYYEGAYMFKFDSTKNEGLPIYNFGEKFPHIKEPQKLIEPLFYIATDQQYKALLESRNPKLAVDNFWLSISDNNMERARQLIRIYYNRVFYANYYFSSYKPGWKTDRGMVYIVYGPPERVYKSFGSEKWEYYKSSYNAPISFSFKREFSSFALNSFRLQRSENYGWHWKEAVESWTRGRIFMFE